MWFLFSGKFMVKNNLYRGFPNERCRIMKTGNKGWKYLLVNDILIQCINICVYVAMHQTFFQMANNMFNLSKELYSSSTIG